jgi:hypothetical protein
MRGPATVDAIAADLLRDLHRDTPLALVHVDDRDDGHDREHAKDDQ